MCRIQLKTGVAIGFLAIFQMLSISLLVTYLIVSVELERFWDQLLETQMMCIVIATISSFLALLPSIALCVYSCELLSAFRDTVDRDLAYSSD